MVADMIRAHRLSRKWSQREVSIRSGIPLPTYFYFERYGEISLRNLCRVAEVFGRTDDLLKALGEAFRTPPPLSIKEILRAKKMGTRKKGRTVTKPLP